MRVDERRKETIEVHEHCGLLPRILMVIGKKKKHFLCVFQSMIEIKSHNNNLLIFDFFLGYEKENKNKKK
jgi:hypothetical protein